MRPCSFEYNPILRQFVDEKPIRLDMTLPAPNVVADKFMISMQRVKLIARNECKSDDLELIYAFSARTHSLDIPFELPGIDWNAHEIPSKRSASGLHLQLHTPGPIISTRPQRSKLESPPTFLFHEAGYSFPRGMSIIFCRRKSTDSASKECPDIGLTRLPDLCLFRNLDLHPRRVLSFLESYHEGSPLPIHREEQIFDDWPERYNAWFTTPIGTLVKKYEKELILDLLEPGTGQVILDAGCGTGVFTLDFLQAEVKVIGLDISLPMLLRARQKTAGHPFHPVLGDMLALPFPDDSFDKTVSVTALEFIEDGRAAIQELFRVTRKGGSIVVATLNSLSPWAEMRKREASEGHPIFQKAIFRSPEELLSLGKGKGTARTAIYFRKDDEADRVSRIEEEGQKSDSNTGAFLAARWIKG